MKYGHCKALQKIYTFATYQVMNMKTNHEIDYRILGSEMQCVEIELDPQETVMAEPGSFMMMDNSIEMQTLFGDGSQKDNGLLGKLFSAGKRLLTGENL